MAAMSPVTTDRGIDNTILQADLATPLLVNLTPQHMLLMSSVFLLGAGIGGWVLCAVPGTNRGPESVCLCHLPSAVFCRERKSARSRNAGSGFAPNPTFCRRTAMPLTPMGPTSCRRLQGLVASHPVFPGFAFTHRFQCRGLTRRPAPASASTAQSLAGPRRLLYVGATRAD